MKKMKFTYFILAFVCLVIVLGFSINETDPKKEKRNNSTIREKLSKDEVLKHYKLQSDNSGNQNITFGTAYYTDNFDGANDTTSLKSRGYKVYYRGSVAQDPDVPTWFQGEEIVFPSFNGPSNGYVAGIYEVVGNFGNIDNWLVLPKKSVASGDSLFFYSRSPLNSTYPDSIRVMYSASGDSIPEAGSWVELGRFKVNTAGVWERRGFSAPSAGANARFAIRYNVVNGGLSGVNSDYIGIDALTIESPQIANDVGAFSIVSPVNANAVTTVPYAPKAVFKNFGTSNQTNVPVTYKITGPVNYTSNKTISSLTSGSTQQVTFDSNFVPSVGTYNVAVYSSLASDGNRNNDTMKSSFTIVQPNYGSGGSYFYANTISSGAPSMPQYCWKDTTGSINLILNKVIKDSSNFYSEGNLDDGFFSLGNILGAGRKIRFGGVSYDSVFIGTNGIIGFSRSGSPDFTSFTPDTGTTVRPAFYPLWIDLNYADPDASINRLSYKVLNGSQLIVTYDRATLFGGNATDYISFQAVVEIVSSASTVNSKLLVQIADTAGGKTGAGTLSKYNSNTLQTVLSGLQSASGSSVTYRLSSGSVNIFLGPLFSSLPVAIEFGADASSLTHNCGTNVSLIMTMLFEGYWNGSSQPADTARVYIRNTFSPYSVIDSAKGLLNSSGQRTFTFPALPKNNYYIVVNQRNHVGTWSRDGGENFFTSSLTYNFSDDITKAYGNNMALVSTLDISVNRFGMYGGDVNQDGIVDGADAADIDNDAFNFATGYVVTDVNGDTIVDGTDGAICDNNAFNFIGTISP